MVSFSVVGQNHLNMKARGALVLLFKQKHYLKLCVTSVCYQQLPPLPGFGLARNGAQKTIFQWDVHYLVLI